MRTNLINKKEEVKKSENPSKDGVLDMVIAFDTTGSMYSYISVVKNHVKELIPKLFSQNPNLRLGIVAFGDYCDMRSKSDFAKAYQVCPLTNDENKLIDFVTRASDTSGGDSDEFYELVIKKITEETNWRENSTKAVLLIADSKPHKVGYSYSNIIIRNPIDWEKEARKAAKKGIKFDTLTINPWEWFSKLSEITGGICAPFRSDSKTSNLVEAAALARGGEATKAVYYTTMDSFKDDSEMYAVYTAYEKEVIS